MFPDRLKELRKEQGVTQMDVASGIHAQLRNYQYYESGEKKPGFDSLIALADFFGVSIDYLVGRTDKPEVNR